MKQELELIKFQLEDFDSDPRRSLLALNNPERKKPIFLAAITHAIMMTCPALRSNEPDIHIQNELQTRANELIKYLNDNYHVYTFSCHDHHFHTDFSSYVMCPFTGITEIVVCLDKMITERFAS